MLTKRNRSRSTRQLRAHLTAAAAMLALVSACGAPAEPPDERTDVATLERLVRHMTGVFSSAEQAATEEGYLDIRLAMARIWRDRDDAVWLYVEQAAARALERPYRQRVYRVRHVGADLYESAVFALPEPLRAVGAWEEDQPLTYVTPDELRPLPGCAVILRALDDGRFRGSTLGTACSNGFGGAAYATSEVTVQSDRLVSWDRGYDTEHEHVWGATTGGYLFVKTRDLEP